MPNDKFEQLIALLVELDSPTPNEFRKITTEFNRYKDRNNPNVEPARLDHETLVYFIADRFKEFELLRVLRDSTQHSEIRIAAGSSMIGYFYEIVTTIKKYDIEGWAFAGFELTNEQLSILKDWRNTKFHIPDDVDLFQERLARVLAWGDLMPTIYANSAHLKKYIDHQRATYPTIEQMLGNAFTDTQNLELRPRISL